MIDNKELSPSALDDLSRLDVGDESDPIPIELLTKIGAVLKTLGHPIRLQIVQYLASGERRVRDIQEHIGFIQASTSQQLRIMSAKGILVARREGTKVYYSLANEFILKILDCLQSVNAKVQSGEWHIDQIGKPHKEIQHDRSFNRNLV